MDIPATVWAASVVKLTCVCICGGCVHGGCIPAELSFKDLIRSCLHNLVTRHQHYYVCVCVVLVNTFEK